MSSLQPHDVQRVIRPEDILRARQVVGQVYIDNRIQDYIVEIVFATAAPVAVRRARSVVDE